MFSNWFVMKSATPAPPEPDETQQQIECTAVDSEPEYDQITLTNGSGEAKTLIKVKGGKISESEKLSLENELLRKQLAELKAQCQQSGIINQHYIYASAVPSSANKKTTPPTKSPILVAIPDVEDSAPSEESQTLDYVDQLKQQVQSMSLPCHPLAKTPEAKEDKACAEVELPHHVMVSSTSLPDSLGTSLPDSLGNLSSDEVCVVDLRSMEWYTVSSEKKELRPETQDKEAEKREEKRESASLESSELGESYVLIQEGDVKDAISEFVVETLGKHLDTKHGPETVRKALTETMTQLKPPTLLDTAYDWGQFLYSTYGWSTCIYNIYMEPAMAKFVFSTAYSTVSWVLVLLL